MLEKISKQIIKPVRIAVLLIMILMVVLVLTQIFCRFVLNISVPWTEEMARLCFIWVIFLGSAVVECEGGQVCTRIFVDWLDRRVKFILGTAIYIVEIVFDLCLFIGCITSWKTVEMMTFSTVPTFHYTLMYIPVLVAAPCMILYLFIQNVNLYHELFPEKGGSKIKWQ